MINKLLIIVLCIIPFRNAIASHNTYTLGGTGEAGGLVFYVSPDGQHGIEAAPLDTEMPVAVPWGCMGLEIPNSKGTAVWTGITNTRSNENFNTDRLWFTDMKCYLFRAYMPKAWQLTQHFIMNTYVDWYVPSKDEMALIYSNLFIQRQGGFHFYDKSKPRCYWTSSMIDSTHAWAQYLDGITPGAVAIKEKSDMCYVRAVRSF